MSVRMLVMLGLGTVVALLLALALVDGRDDSPVAAGDRPLLPGLADRINDIEALDILAPGGETVATLRRERARWRMREKHDYEADFALIHGLLRDLAEARRLEARTDKPQWHARLGVAPPGEDEGSGAMVRFPGTDLPVLIVGKPDPAGIGRYVRLGEDPQVWLTGQDLELPVERMAWLERAIMDMPAAEIREVTVRHPDGDRVELRPGDKEGSVWVMLHPPADREVKQAWQLRQTASALAKLNMDDVRPHEDAAPVPPDAVETVFRTRDGMVFTARSFSDEEGNWVHFRVHEGEVPEAAKTLSEAEPTEPGGASGVQPASAGATEREIDIVAVDGRLSPWQFSLEKERFERLRPTSEDLLVPPEDSVDD